ncbi:MAG: helix-turn-helix domain-containing protein [Actinomycetota bacterium]|nr:helix-turn-helix domain-containing protein [Actinomycetota bacterium]
MKTYTTQEAAKLTGSSVRALRKRIERGQLRAVQHGRYWRIPHAELERNGMVVPSEGTPAPEGTEGTDNGAAVVMAELERIRAENGRLTQELARLRPLPAQIERVTEDLQRERAERLAAQAQGAAQAQAADELRERERQLAEAGFFERRRLLRDLRARGAGGA